MQANNLEQSEAAIYLYLTFVSTFAVGATNARQCNDSEIKDSQSMQYPFPIREIGTLLEKSSIHIGMRKRNQMHLSC